ncbi:MAG: hypothetical protein IH591_06205 [Bacteroidales bacterium]|nr:hypothetical protein [Bacteroidales bacterium]
MKDLSWKIKVALLSVMSLMTATGSLFSQAVPQGIYYQAVARDNTGKELTDRNIDVRFSILTGTPLGPVVYQELHQAVKTSQYGVFTLTIGSGVPVGGTVGELSQVNWGSALHFLKVEVKFINDFSDMGTMQFLSVPYALFAAKSLEPGPVGPQGPQGLQGPPGDPATDNQTLSFNGANLTITGNPGNTVNLTSLINDADPNPTNEIQYLSLKGDTLSITGPGGIANWVTFAALDVNDADADPLNEIQDLRLTGNILKITKNNEATEIDLTKYVDNTDNQTLTWNPATRVLGLTNSTFSIDLSRSLSFIAASNTLSISGGNSVDLTPLKNDADADPANELISSVALQGSELVITEGGLEKRVDFSTNMIAFRAKKLTSTAASSLTDITFIPGTVEENYGNAFNGTTGEFTAPVTGVYTFYVNYYADGSGSARKLSIFKNSSLFEDIAIEISSGTLTTRSITIRLTMGDILRLVINTGTSTQTGTGTFSGFRVY